MYNPLLTNAILFIVLIGVFVAISYLKDSLCEKVVAILLAVNLAAFFVSWALGLVATFPSFGVFIIEPILAPFLAVLSAAHLKRFKNKRFIVTLMILNCAIGLFSAFVLYGLLGLSA